MALGPVEPIETSFVDRRGVARRAFRWPARRPFMGLLLLHTFAGHAGRYARPGGEIALTGITVEAIDLPGHGTAPGERGAIGDWSAILDDVADRLAALRAELPGRPVAIYGHGLGGAIAVDYERSGRPPADALVLVVPALARPERKPSRLDSLFGRRRVPERGPLVLDPSQMTAELDLLASWQADPLAVWDYPASTVATVEDARARAGADLTSFPRPVLLIENPADPIAPLERRQLHLRQNPPDHVMSVRGGVGHDLPNDLEWQRRAREAAGFLGGVASRHWPGAIPANVAPVDFDAMPRAEAVAAFDAYVAGEVDRLSQFRADVGRLAGPALGCDRESMNQLGRWLFERLEWGEPPADPPSWFSPRASGHELSAQSVRLVEGASTYFVACLREVAPELTWRLCTTKIDAYYQRPVLEPIHLCPPVPVGNVIHQARTGEWRPDWLGDYWAVWRNNLGVLRERGFVEEPDDALPLDEIGVDPYDAHPRFNAQIWIPEGAEIALGPERFDGLEERLGKLKGIEDFAHEDREVFLVRVADGVDLDALRTRVVGVLRRQKHAAAREETEDTD
jgi:pimeloyl-ACP methyl ester carboxylesterase